MTSNLVVTKGNEMIQASYSLSVSETRVILLCLSKIDSRKPLTLDYEFTITVDDFHDELGVDRATAYRDLRAAVDRLYERSILIDASDQGSMIRWLCKKAYFRLKGEVNIAFSPQLLPYISELKNRFTSYKLKDVAKFKSSYSVRIYELLMQFKDGYQRKFAVNELREILDLGSKYAKIIDLKKYVLIPALKDINEHSNLVVALSQEKRGKEITKLIFKYSIRGVIDTKKKLTKEYIAKNAKIGESWESARERLEREIT